ESWSLVAEAATYAGTKRGTCTIEQRDTWQECKTVVDHVVAPKSRLQYPRVAEGKGTLHKSTDYRLVVIPERRSAERIFGKVICPQIETGDPFDPVAGMYDVEFRKRAVLSTIKPIPRRCYHPVEVVNTILKVKRGDTIELVRDRYLCGVTV